MIIESETIVKYPRVSVVIATYNQVAYIEQTILSAINQKTDFPFEIVVGDDGSNDGERELLIDIQKRYPQIVRLVFNEANLWVTRNYISAIKESRGLYIASLDGDDIWTDVNKLQKQYDILEYNSRVSLVHTGYRSFDSTSNKVVNVVNHWESPLLNESGRHSVEQLLLCNFSSYPLGSSSMFRREVYLSELNKYDALINDKGSVGEGTLLNVICANYGCYYFIETPMVDYRILSSSLSHFDSSRKHIDFSFRYIKHRIIAGECSGLNEAALERVVAKGLSDLLKSAIASRQYIYFRYMTLLLKNDLSEYPNVVAICMSYRNFYKYFSTLFSMLLEKVARSFKQL